MPGSVLGARGSHNRTDHPTVLELSVYWVEEEVGLCIAYISIIMIEAAHGSYCGETYLKRQVPGLAGGSESKWDLLGGH